MLGDAVARTLCACSTPRLLYPVPALPCACSTLRLLYPAPALPYAPSLIQPLASRTCCILGQPHTPPMFNTPTAPATAAATSLQA